MLWLGGHEVLGVAGKRRLLRREMFSPNERLV